MTPNTKTIDIVELEDLLPPRQPGHAAAHGLLSWHTIAQPGAYTRPDRRSVATWHLERDARTQHDEAAASLTQGFGPIRCLHFQDCTLAGQGSLVTRNAGLLRESAREFLAHGQTPDGFSCVDGALQITPAPARSIRTPCLLVKRPWFRNYGHWLVDSAALLALNPLQTLPPNTQPVIGRCDSPKMQAIIAETLNAVAPGHTALLHPDDEVWHFRNLHYVTPVHQPPLFKLPVAIGNLRRALLPPDAPPPPACRRLFVVRSDADPRRLVNAAALQDICATLGFEEIRPETLTLHQQATAFASAEIIVGVKGAALTNLLFCRPGTAIILLSPGDFPDPFFWDLAAIAGADITEIYGLLTRHDRPAGKNPFTIYEPDFLAVLQGRLAAIEQHGVPGNSPNTA